jgi:hypothetical protein
VRIAGGLDEGDMGQRGGSATRVILDHNFLCLSASSLSEVKLSLRDCAYDPLVEGEEFQLTAFPYKSMWFDSGV